MFHTLLLHPLAQTPLLKKYQQTSSDIKNARRHIANAPAPPLLVPNRPPLAVLLPKRPLAEDAPVPAAAGAPVGTMRSQYRQRTNPMIKPLLSQSRTNRRACISFDFRLGLHIVLFANLQIHRVLFALVFGH